MSTSTDTGVPQSDPNQTWDYPNSVSVVTGYEILDRIAMSGMSTIYRARETTSNREVAVKILQPPADQTRLAFEAAVTSQLQHPGIVPVHHIGTLPGGRPFMVMKLIKGRTLDDIIRDRSSLTENLTQLVRVFEEVCRTVAYAHARGVIHRNLKPRKVMIGAFGEVQVLGWGLARLVGD